MVNALNKNLIQKLIRKLHGNSLDGTTVERIASSITSIASTLEGAGFRVSFDTQPAIATPAEFTANGLLTSFQLIGRLFAEEMLFRVAAAYENATNWHQKHQRYDSYV